MNRRIRFAATLFAACSTAALAQQGTTLPPVRVTRFIAECAPLRLPAQRQVGEWTGLHNFDQVYAARERLMARIGRACQRHGVSRVQVVVRQGEPRVVAIALQTR